MKKYQFKRIICSQYSVEDTLNQYGELGFRSINVKDDGDRYIILMEREYNEFSMEDIENAPYRLSGFSSNNKEENL